MVLGWAVCYGVGMNIPSIQAAIKHASEKHSIPEEELVAIETPAEVKDGKQYTVIAASTYRHGLLASEELGIPVGYRDHATIVTPKELPRIMGVDPTRIVFVRPNLSADLDAWNRLELELRIRALRRRGTVEEYIY